MFIFFSALSRKEENIIIRRNLTDVLILIYAILFLYCILFYYYHCDMSSLCPPLITRCYRAGGPPGSQFPTLYKLSLLFICLIFSKLIITHTNSTLLFSNFSKLFLPLNEFTDLCIFQSLFSYTFTYTFGLFGLLYKYLTIYTSCSMIIFIALVFVC